MASDHYHSSHRQELRDEWLEDPVTQSVLTDLQSLMEDSLRELLHLARSPGDLNNQPAVKLAAGQHAVVERIMQYIKRREDAES